MLNNRLHAISLAAVIFTAVLLTLTLFTIQSIAFTSGLPVHEQQLGGRVREVVLKGNYLYVAEGARLVVYDMTDPVQPQPVGDIVPSGGFYREIWQVVVEGDYAYISTLSDLTIVDVSDPTQPERAGRFGRIGGTHFIKSGDIIYLSAQLEFTGTETIINGLRSIDVSDPTNPQQLDFLAPTSGVSTFGKMLLVGNYIYADKTGGGSISDDGVVVFDISNPANLSQVAFHTGFDAADITISGDVLFARKLFSNSSNDHILLYSVANAPDLEFIQAIGTDGFEDQGPILAVDDKLFYPSRKGIVYFDISDPTNPVRGGFHQQIPSAEPGGTALDITYQNGLVVTGHYIYGFHIDNFSDTTPETVSHQKLSLTQANMVEANESGVIVANDVTGQFNLIEQNDGELVIYGVSPYVDHGLMSGLELIEDTLFAASRDELVIYQRTDIGLEWQSTTEYPTIEGLNYFQSIAIENNILYSGALGKSTVLLYDVSDPVSPALSKTISLTVDIKQLLVHDSLLYVTGSNDKSIYLFDTDTGALVNSIMPDAINVIGEIMVVDDILYAVGSENKLFVIDVADPNALSLLDTEAITIGRVFEIMLVDSNLYLSGSGNVGYVTYFDASDPRDLGSEQFVETFGTFGGGDMALYKGKLVVSDRQAGVWVSNSVGVSVGEFNIYLPTISR